MHTVKAVVDAAILVEQVWQEKLATFDREGGLRSDVEEIASSYGHGTPCRVIRRFEGGYNHCFALRFEKDEHGTEIEWLLRFPVPGRVQRPEEKVNQEVAVMKYISANTSIPVPKVIASGTADGRFAGLGPYFIMEFMPGERLDELFFEEGKLKTNIDQAIVTDMYRQLARIYLEISDHEFDQIGGLCESSGNTSWYVATAPLTLKVNEAEALAGANIYGQSKNDEITENELIEGIDCHTQPFTKTKDYLEELINQHKQILVQNEKSTGNKASEEEYRCLNTLQKLTQEFVASRPHHKPFKLFLDDLRFGNILVDPATFRITALIDWEFCYAAPREFINCPPPWLLPNPDPWDWSADDRIQFKVQYKNFFRVLKDTERRTKRDNSFSSQRQAFMEDGTFWYLQAIREPLCCVELVYAWSSETNQPLEEACLEPNS